MPSHQLWKPAMYMDLAANYLTGIGLQWAETPVTMRARIGAIIVETQGICARI